MKEGLAYSRKLQCEDFGAEPVTSGAETLTVFARTNAAAIQAALDRASELGGGTVTLDEPGTYYVSAQLTGYGNTDLCLGAGVALRVHSTLGSNVLVASTVDNFRVIGAGTIICTAATVPSFTNVDGLEVSVRIETADGQPLSASITSSSFARRPDYQGIARTRPARALLLGDSITANYLEEGPAVTAVANNGDGTATITFSGSHNFSVGQRCYVNVSPLLTYNTFGAVITALVNTNPYTITYTLDTGTHKPQVVGSVASDTDVFYTERKSCVGWPAWFEFLAGSKIDYVLAVAGGADSDEILTMLGTVNADYDAIFLAPGMNDIYADGLTFDACVDRIEPLIRAVALTGKPATLFSVPPRLSSASGWSEAKQTVHNRLNLWMHALARQLGIVFVDTWRATHNGSTWVNAGAANPDPTTLFTNASDGTHPLNVGAYAMAHAVPSSVKSLFAADYIPAHPDMDTQNNVLTNSRFAGTGGTKTPASGTINGNAPDSWTIEITAGTPTVNLTIVSRSVSADGDADGSNLEAVFTYSGTGTQIFRMIQSGLHSVVTAGNTMDIEWPVVITSATGMTGMELVLFGARSSGGSVNIGHLLGTSSAMAGAFTGTFRIKDWVVPTGLTSLLLFARFYFTSGGATILFKRPYFRTRD